MSDLQGLFSFPDGPPTVGADSVVRVRFDAEHALFSGHFPERPVVPGVCMVQVATVIASGMHGASLRLLRARSIKFLAPVDPRTTPELLFHTVLSGTDTDRRVEVQALADDTVVMKLTAELIPEVD